MLKGSGVEPQVDFSFEEYDFGPRFIHRADMPANKTTVTVTNNDKKDVRYFFYPHWYKCVNIITVETAHTIYVYL